MQKGFTLVELAIVLMIIGLLIGGILKGQEMIVNARVVSTVSQLKTYTAATITFIDAYGGKPGDITDPSTRLSNCTTSPCSTAGDGDGVIGSPSPGWGAYAQLTGETANYWRHLVAAGLITEALSDTTSAYVMKTPVGVVYLTEADIIIANYAGFSEYATNWKGPYFILTKLSGSLTQVEPNNQTMTMSAAAAGMIDRKMDDGLAYSGRITTVNYYGNGTDATICSSGPNYLTTKTGCNIAVRAGF